ncbi:MAG: hypothetical protein OHK0036_17790 [Bacteroidia bacterium]
MITYEQLGKELYAAARQTKLTQQKIKHYLNISQIVEELKTSFLNHHYQPGTYTCFAVADPTPREILAPSYADRIVHRWLVNKMEPYVDKRLLPCSYANRKGKGHHQAVLQLQKYLHNYEYLYYLKADIKSFFNSIHHPTLLLLVKRWIQHLPYSEQEKSLIEYIAHTIITHNPTQNVVFTGNAALLQKIPPHKSYFNNPPGIGLPLGNLTSQFFANIYLHELDWYIKHHLKIKCYLRYVDDFVILGKSYDELKHIQHQIHKFLEEKLHLSLHPQKIRIQPVKNGIDFCGYVVWAKSIIVRKRVLAQFRKKLNFFKYLLHYPEYAHWRLSVSGNSYLEKAFRQGHCLCPSHSKITSLLRRIECSIASYRGIIHCFDSRSGMIVK